MKIAVELCSWNQILLTNEKWKWQKNNNINPTVSLKSPSHHPHMAPDLGCLWHSEAAGLTLPHPQVCIRCYQDSSILLGPWNQDLPSHVSLSIVCGMWATTFKGPRWAELTSPAFQGARRLLVSVNLAQARSGHEPKNISLSGMAVGLVTHISDFSLSLFFLSSIAIETF